jgi:hypothetical protein
MREFVAGLRTAMKTKLLTALCVLALLSTTTSAVAGDDDKSLNIVADVGLVRPSCFVVTIAGSALFVVALPFAAMSKSVKKTAHTLVAVPAKATFTRPVGDFTSLQE